VENPVESHIRAGENPLPAGEKPGSDYRKHTSNKAYINERKKKA
jgi:hypothetical protein